MAKKDHHDKGSTAVEYALIAAFIVIAIVVTLSQMGVSLRGAYQDIASAFTG